MDVVFFIYGLAFFSLGLVVLVQPREESRYELSQFIGLLAFFGLAHGALEWMDLWKIVRGDSSTLALLKVIFLFASFVFLFEFGRSLTQSICNTLSSVPNYVKTMLGTPLYGVVVLGFLFELFMIPDWILAITIATRYFLGFVGSSLAGIGFLLSINQKLPQREERPAHFWADKYFALAAVSFILYGVLGGVVVPLANVFPANVINDQWFLATFQFPVQIFRATCAVLATIAVGSILLIFHQEVRERLLSGLRLAKENEQRFRSTLENAPIGMFVAELDGRFLQVNHALCNILGYEQDELERLSFRQVTHPDDLDVMSANTQELLNGMNHSYEMEKRYIRKDGQQLMAHLSISILRDDDGKPLYFIGQVEDITDRKRAEENVRITASVFGSSQEAIVITDANNTVIDVNPAFTRITGYSREEIIGKNPKLLSSGRQGKTFYAKMWQSLRESKTWRGEIWNRRKSGEVYAEMLSISSVCDNEGKVLRYVAVFSDISHIKEHEAELTRVAHYDGLTGIPNRVLLSDRMKQAIAQTIREQNMMAICYLDLDGFKHINDTKGHDAGDQVLIEVADRIGKTIRGGDTVARLGGDEFVVMLLGQEKGEECVATLERLLVAITQPITIKDESHTVSASIGVSIYPLDDEDPDTLLRHADQAMYVAKQSGKNRYHIYDPALDQRARDQHDFMKSIRHGLEHGQFELYYQPKINLRTKELVGAEALIRWQHPERGLLSPAEFLRQIENTELDAEIGEWVTDTALAQLNSWCHAGMDIGISINISGYHMESGYFVKRLQHQIEHYPDIPFGKFQIEVLETVALNDLAIVSEIIEACKEFGVGFALDDFGTGYSSLSYLSKLPVDALKIDQSFVRDMLEDKGDKAIVQGIIALARAFNRQTVAEGIECEEHYQALLDMNCELGQGYFIARPMPADELANWQIG